MFDRFEAFELEWDPKLGGRGTMPYRELLAFTAGRLRHHGASSADVVAYLGALLEVFDRASGAPRVIS